LANINQAEIISDGQQILVGVQPVVNPGKSKVSKSITKSSSVIVHINTATLSQLQALRGVGPVTAQKVLSYKKAHGLFTTVEEFKKAAGLGVAKFDAIKSQLRL
jgi:competence protein ComEA